MSRYKKYSYWYRPGVNGGAGCIINNRHRDDNPAGPNDIFLGKWFSHEKTPYIQKGENIFKGYRVVRDYYNQKQVFMGIYGPGEGWVECS